MGSSQNLTNTRWRKSSYSGNTGGDCVEVADLGILTLSPKAYAAFVTHVAVK
ncbi:DUF397 domain-containing protein [Streptomyces coeruleorubidus]|uniref:DUF397 domain-containing protein n=1 Tax=Streptomyces coeruleorubidus TaxID=116188 RepID=UPI0037AA0E64